MMALGMFVCGWTISSPRSPRSLKPLYAHIAGTSAVSKAPIVPQLNDVIAGAVGPASIPAGLNLLSLVAVDPTTGVVTYDPSKFRFLGVNETVQYSIAFESQVGESIIPETLLFTISGLDDPPVFSTSSVPISLSEIAGKTGSAQIVSLATRARFKNAEDLAQNGWFVGFTPRRNPDIVVCVLFEGGEHGKLAARIATQVLKSYVDKQRRIPAKMAEKTKDKGDGPVEIGGLWTAPEGDKLEGGRFLLNLPKKPSVLATAAPGIVSKDYLIPRVAISSQHAAFSH